MIINSFTNFLPKFAHLHMILDVNKGKISKRDNSSYIFYYKNNVFLPISILNYIVRVGWSHKNQEIFSLDDMIKFFDFKSVSKSSSCFDINKLLWLNKYYLQQSSLNDLLSYILPISKKFNFNFFYGPSLLDLLKFTRHRFFNLFQLLDSSMFFYSHQINLNKFFFLSNFSIIFLFFFFFDLKLSRYVWCLKNIKSHVDFFVKENNICFSDFSFSIRLIITGTDVSNPFYEIIFLCGKILLLKKIINIINKLDR